MSYFHKPCKNCSKKIDPYNAVCPECGEKDPIEGITRNNRIFSNVMAFAIIGGIIYGAYSFLFGAPSEEEIAAEKAELELCMKNLGCIAERKIIQAGNDCAIQINRFAKYDVEWTDSLGQKFSRYRWLDSTKVEVTYIGDKVKFQNGFGAWQNMRYECDYDAANESVLGVRVIEGRL